MILLRSPDPEEDDRQFEAERQAERIAQHAPAPLPSPRVSSNPPLTSAMESLAWTVLHGTWHDARDASKVLAELVLEASETASPGEG